MADARRRPQPSSRSARCESVLRTTSATRRAGGRGQLHADRRHHPARRHRLRAGPLARHVALVPARRSAARASSSASTSWRRPSGGDEAPCGGWSAASVGVVARWRAALVGTRTRPGGAARDARSARRRRACTWVLTERTYRRNPERLTSADDGGVRRQAGVLRRVRGGDAARAVAAPRAVRRQLHGLFHRAAPDRGAVSAAPVCGRHDSSMLFDGRPSRSTQRTREPPQRRRREVQRRRDHHRARLEQQARSSADPSADDRRASTSRSPSTCSCCGSSRRSCSSSSRWTVRRYLKQDRLGPVRLHERARGGRRVRPRLDRAAERRHEVGEHLDAADPHVLRLHPLRQRDRPDSDLRRARRCSITSCCTPAEDSFLTQRAARRHDGDRATSTSRRRWRRSRSARSSSPARKAHGFVKHWKNLVPHGLRLADLHPADSDRDHGHVRPAVRADDATCGQHDGRPHRDSGDSVVRVPLHGDVRPRGRRHRRRPGRVGAAGGRRSRRSRSSSFWSRRTCSRCLTAVFIGMAIHAHH